MTNKFPKKKFLKKNVRMVQFCCVKGQPLAIDIENAAKKSICWWKLGQLVQFLAMLF